MKMVRLLNVIWALVIAGSTLAHAQITETSAQPVSQPSASSNDERDPPEGVGTSRTERLQVDADGNAEITPADEFPLPFEFPEVGASHPAAYVAAVEFKADVIDGFADGQLVTEVVVTRNQGWHVVDLNLNQAICRNWEYAYEGEGEGESSPVINPARNDGLTWQFRGVGRHRLTLTMRVPLHRTAAGQQLLLALPPLPREFETIVELRFDSEVRARRPDEETMFRQTTDESGRTTVNVGVTGPRLELNWDDARASAAQVAQVSTRWSVGHDQSSEQHQLIATAEQDLRPENGTLEFIDVSLPMGWEFVSVSGERYLSHEVLPETGLLRVHLRDADTQFGLRWRLRRDIAVPRDEVSIDGLEVVGAPLQSGDISVESPADWEVDWQPSSSEGIDRSTPRPGTPSGSITFAYQFQPFRLEFGLKQRLPQAVIRPRWFLHASPERLELQAEFEVDERGGPARLLEVVWPGAAEEGWNLIWINDPSRSEIEPEIDVAFRSGSLSIPVPEESHVVRMRLWRPIDIQGAFELTLPRVQAPLVEIGWLIQQCDDAVVLGLALDEGAAEFAVNPSAIDFNWPLDFSQDESTSQPYSPEQGALQATLAIHEREIEANSTVTIEDVSQHWVSVSQTFDLDVRYGELSSIELLIPDALREFIRPEASRGAIEFLVNGEAARFRWPDHDQPLVVLDRALRPLRGAAVIEARYKFPWDQSQGDRLSLPVLALPVAETAATRCLLAGIDLTPVIVEGQGWRQIPTAPDAQVWEYSGSTLAVPLALAPVSQTQLTRQSVGSAFCSIEFQADASYRVVMQLNLSPDSRMWSCELPDRAQGEQFFLGDTAVQTQRATLNGRISHVVRLTPEQCELRIEYTISSQRPVGVWEEVEIELPAISESIWIEELFLEATFPDGMHLFSSPRGWTQEFQWQRTGFFWSRQPTERLATAREQLATSEAVAPSGVHYGFSRFGATPRLSFVWMSRPLIVLLGAGLTLLLGFVLTRFPAVRGPLPVLFLGFAFSIVGLWYPAPLELLLQPALLGLVLAWGASRLGASSRRRRTQGLEPRMDLVTNGPSSVTPTGKFPVAPALVSGTQSTIYRPMGQVGSSSSPPKSVEHS